MRALARHYDRFHALIGGLCGLLIGWIVITITVDVTMRNLKLGSLSWAMEVNEYALYAITSLGAPWALYRGAHVRVDLLVKGVPKALGRLLEGLADLVGLVASAVLLYYALAVAAASARGGARLIKILIIPEWWVYAVVAFGAALLVVEFLRRFAVALAAGPHADSRQAV